MISDYEIDVVLKKAESCFNQTSGFKGKYREKYFLECLHVSLHDTQSGMNVGVCHSCFGTGYEELADDQPLHRTLVVGMTEHGYLARKKNLDK